MSSSSVSHSRIANHWVADALAADEALDFSVVRAVVCVSQDSLAGAPEAARERVALRCLQECAAAAGGGGAEGEAVTSEVPAPAPAATGGRLSFEASRSCEDMLLALISEVGSSGSLEKDKLPLFSQEIQKFICIKKPTLPETSLELLREISPEITSLVSPSPTEHNRNGRSDEDQLLCDTSRDNENVDKLRFATDGAQLQQERLATMSNKIDTGNFQGGPTEPTADMLQPCASDSRCCDHPQEDAIDTNGVNIRVLEKDPSNERINMPVAAVPAFSCCNTTLHESITESTNLPEQDVVQDATMVQVQSHGSKSPNPPQYNNGKRVHDDGPSVQPSKNPMHKEPSMPSTVAPVFDSSDDAVPKNTSIELTVPEDVTMVQQTHLNSPRNDSGEKVNQDMDDGSTSVPPMEKDPSHESLTVQITGALASGSGAVAMQVNISETSRHPKQSIIDHTTMVEQENGKKAHLDSSLVSNGDKVNQTLHGDGNILEKNAVHSGVNVQTAPASHSCNIALQDYISEANQLAEQNIGKNSTVVQNPCCSRPVPNSTRDSGGKGAKQASNDKSLQTTVGETSNEHSTDDSFSNFAAAGHPMMTQKLPFSSQNQDDAHGSLGGFTEQDLCIKCGQEGQLLKCGGGCLLVAHESCFGSSFTFDDSGQFYCPVCFYTKAAEAYRKARKTYSQARDNLSAFLGNKQAVKQSDRHPTKARTTATNSEGHFNGCHPSKRQDSHQPEVANLSHQVEEPDQQMKKQKANAGIDASCSVEKISEKASDRVASSVKNADAAPMNREPVLQNHSKQVQTAEHEQPAGNAEVREEAGHGISSHEARHSSSNICSTSAAHLEVKTGKGDGPANSHQSEYSEDIEASSSNDTGKRPLPPWRNTRNVRLRERDTSVFSDTRKAFECHNGDMPSPSKKRNYVYPPKRYSNPVAPSGRRSKLCWTEQEEAALREAMAKFIPRDNEPIPWIQILEYGRHVFHRTRLPSDLRVKWRNMKKKEAP